jgi:hypothetical protein
VLIDAPQLATKTMALIDGDFNTVAAFAIADHREVNGTNEQKVNHFISASIDTSSSKHDAVMSFSSCLSIGSSKSFHSL